MQLHFFCFVSRQEKVSKTLRNYTVCDSDEEGRCFQGLVKPEPQKTDSDDPMVETAHLVKKQRCSALQLSSSSSPSLLVLALLFPGRDTPLADTEHQRLINSLTYVKGNLFFSLDLIYQIIISMCWPWH